MHDGKCCKDEQFDKDLLQSEAVKFESKGFKKNEKVQDLILRGKFGRQIAELNFDDMGENGKHLVPEAKVFIGLDTCIDDEDNMGKSSRAKYTFITSSSEQTVAFKCLPEHLLDLLRYEKKCLKLM